MLILDRFEGDIAVIESDEGMKEVKRSEVNASEGDVLRLDGGKYVTDIAATAERKQKIAQMYKNRLGKRKSE